MFIILEYTWTALNLRIKLQRILLHFGILTHTLIMAINSIYKKLPWKKEAFGI